MPTPIWDSKTMSQWRSDSEARFHKPLVASQRRRSTPVTRAASRQRLVQLAERGDQGAVGRVVDRAGDDADGVVGERCAQRRQQFVGRRDAVALRAEALGVGDEVGIAERGCPRCGRSRGPSSS